MNLFKSILNNFITHLITAIISALFAGHYLLIFKTNLITHISMVIYFMVTLLIIIVVLLFYCFKKFLTNKNLTNSINELTAYMPHENGYLLDKNGLRYCPAHEKPVLLSRHYITHDSCLHYCPRSDCHRNLDGRFWPCGL